jgi:cytochrome c oxidase subunit IV
MSTQGNVEAEGHQAGSTGVFVAVWLALAGLTGIEVLLGYEQLVPVTMLTILVVLSVFKAGLIVAYFMHLKYERFSLFLALVPPTLFCIMMICIFFFPDSLRILQLGVQAGLK